MKILKNPKKNDWVSLINRPIFNYDSLQTIVKEVFENVKIDKTQALLKYTQMFDNVVLNNIRASSLEIENAETQISNELKQAINQAYSNIYAFHYQQIEKTNKIETCKGVLCWRESRAIEKVGIYIPGGSAPLFSTVLMLAIPAKIAGVKEIVLCTPPYNNGNINPAILYAAKLSGITNICKVGGIQAIAALTYGTDDIKKVYKIFGPGNQYVTAAKQYAQNFGVAIDMPAGPSEVLIIADESSISEFVAADLLSQAEHGIDSQVVLLTNSAEKLKDIKTEINIQLEKLPRREIATEVINNSYAIIFENIEECIEFSNLYAPEHLIVAIDNPYNFLNLISNAGSVFIGNYSCESAGDYASGTNHTLPTNGFAKSYSGVSLDSFVKKISFQEINIEGIKNIGNSIELMAEAEDLSAHKNAVSIRLNYINKLKQNQNEKY